MTADRPELAAINRVLTAHADELMAIRGVVGVAVGLLHDGQTPCLRVLVEALTPELQAHIPRTLDGHPVVVEETGTIRPLDGR